MEKQLKTHPNLKPIAAATLLALATISPTAQAASNAELEAQVKALTQLVEQLRQDVAKKTDSANVATQEDVEGVRADLENFKYDQERSRERNTVKSARDTTFFGVVQIRAQGQSESTTSGNPAPSDSRKSTFEVPTALFGLRGNLYRDYVDGKNLDYQLSFTYAKRTTQAGGTSDLNLADAFVRYHLTSTNGGLEVPRVNLTKIFARPSTFPRPAHGWACSPVRSASSFAATSNPTWTTRPITAHRSPNSHWVSSTATPRTKSTTTGIRTSLVVPPSRCPFHMPAGCAS